MMLSKIRGRGVPGVFLILAILWTATIVGPVLYSLAFPAEDIRRIVRALEGRDTLSPDLAPLIDEVTRSAGQMRRAGLVGVSWRASGEYNVKKSRTVKTTQASYLAWFEKRQRPTLLVITRTEVDRHDVRYEIDEGSPYAPLRTYLLLLLALALTLYWFRRSSAARVPDTSQQKSAS